MPRLVSNPPNPWSTTAVEWLGEPPPTALQVFAERGKSLLTKNESPDVPFRWSANPYRGCQHACAYCYARPSHEYLDWGAGTDFDTKIVVKQNAAELLARELARPRLRGERIAFSGVTDCYQPLEASYELTRACLQVCLEHRNGVDIITKGALVRRDAQLLARIAERCGPAGSASSPAGRGARVFASITFANDGPARRLEPWAAAPSVRFETLRRLSEAGVPTGVALAPLIPGLSEPDVPEILERAREAGATSAFLILLRLPGSVATVFEERLRQAFPERADKVMAAQREMHGGRLNDARFGSRMSGSGPRWKIVEDFFELHRRRLGFELPASEQTRGGWPGQPEGPSAVPRQRDLF